MILKEEQKIKKSLLNLIVNVMKWNLERKAIDFVKHLCEGMELAELLI